MPQQAEFFNVLAVAAYLTDEQIEEQLKRELMRANQAGWGKFFPLMEVLLAYAGLFESAYEEGIIQKAKKRIGEHALTDQQFEKVLEDPDIVKLIDLMLDRNRILERKFSHWNLVCRLFRNRICFFCSWFGW